MATTNTPGQIDSRLRSMLKTSEAGRKDALQLLSARADEEEQSLLRVREKLAKKVDAEDPRLQALDNRTRGVRIVAAFARGTDLKPRPVKKPAKKVAKKSPDKNAKKGSGKS